LRRVLSVSYVHQAPRQSRPYIRKSATRADFRELLRLGSSGVGRNSVPDRDLTVTRQVPALNEREQGLTPVDDNRLDKPDFRHLQTIANHFLLTTNQKVAGSSPAERAPEGTANGGALFFPQHRRAALATYLPALPHPLLVGRSVFGMHSAAVVRILSAAASGSPGCSGSGEPARFRTLRHGTGCTSRPKSPRSP
jgi:hypothetical protein